MTLLTVLCCLALQRFIKIDNWFQVSWFETYLHQLKTLITKLNEWIALLVIVLPILVIAGLLRLFFLQHLHGILDLFFSIVIVLLCVDAHDVQHKLTAYFSSTEKNDLQLATQAADWLLEDTHPSSLAELYRTVTTGILAQSFSKLFAGMFWFIVLDIYGALAYFLLNLLRQHALKIDANYAGIHKLASHLHDLADWLPSRLVAISYALAGNFNRSFSYCSGHLWIDSTKAKKYSVEAGLAALSAPNDPTKAQLQENYEALNLINRTLILWIVAIALISLGVWL